MKILWISDGVKPTGFSRVAHSILEYFPEEYEVDWLAINYFGDPHDYRFRIYPAYVPETGDFYGYSKIARLARNKYDLIFILNDVWVIDNYLEAIKQSFNPIPPIVIYTPVDALNHYPIWYKNFDIVSKVVAYNSYGKSIIEKASEIENIGIIPHGIDQTKFYKLDDSQEEIRKKLLDRDDFINAKLIFLNGNRNQPRKQIWNSIIAFSIFAEGKKDAFFIYHGGYVDADIDVVQLSKALNVQDKVILTNKNKGPATLTDKDLNLVYNVASVGVNTSTGEGWGLVNVEHAMTGALQIVPRHSSFMELFEDCGLFVEPSSYFVNPGITTIGLQVNPYHVAEAFQHVYDNPHIIEALGNKAREKFSRPEYSWANISLQWQNLFEEVLNGNNLSIKHSSDNK